VATAIALTRCLIHACNGLSNLPLTTLRGAPCSQMPIADEAPDGLYDDDGYLDTDGDNSGYMETAPAEDEDF